MIRVQSPLLLLLYCYYLPLLPHLLPTYYYLLLLTEYHYLLLPNFYLLSTCYYLLPLTTKNYFLLTTYYFLLLSTYYYVLLSTTYYLLLTAYYYFLLTTLTTCNLPLTEILRVSDSHPDSHSIRTDSLTLGVNVSSGGMRGGQPPPNSMES